MIEKALAVLLALHPVQEECDQLDQEIMNGDDFKLVSHCEQSLNMTVCEVHGREVRSDKLVGRITSLDVAFFGDIASVTTPAGWIAEKERGADPDLNWIKWKSSENATSVNVDARGQFVVVLLGEHAGAS